MIKKNVKAQLTKEEKIQNRIRRAMLLCLMVSLGILLAQFIDKRFSENVTRGMNIAFVILWAAMTVEGVYRIIRITKKSGFSEYIKFDKAEFLYLIGSAVIVPLSLFVPSILGYRIICLLKLPNVLRRYNDENVFQIIAKGIAVLLILFFLVPFFNVFANALSAPGQIINVVPKNIDLFAMKYVLSDKAFLRSFGNSIFITLVGTLISVVSMAMAAYPLSKPHMPLRKTMMMFFMIVMLFSGGIAPNILLVNSLGLMDTIWALILPSVVMVYYLLLLKGFYESIPAELEESAKLDGASNFSILFKIVMPIASPMIATVSFFTAITYWNNINNSILYVTNNKSIYPVPMYIKNFLGQNPMEVAMNNPTLLTYWDGIKMSYVLMSIIPIAIAYPFIFKYLKNDVSAGAVKG